MHKSVRFVVTVPAGIATRVTDPSRDPAERGAILADLITGGGRWYAAHVYRRGFVPIGVLAVMPETAARFLVLAADNSKYRRTIIRGLAAWDAWLFVGADRAQVDTPPAAIEGVPLADFWAAQESALALADEWQDARVSLADGAARKAAV